jgi:raffinose/stachyose/melibiose transport system substrate-binding protein
MFTVTQSRDLSALRINRRRLLQTTGGVAAGAAMSGALGLITIGGASAADSVTVTIWGNHPEWKDPMQAIVDAFQAATPGVKVELTELTGPDYTTKLQTAVAGGQPSDILGSGEGDIISKWVPSGDPPFIDLTGKIDVSGLSGAALSQVKVGDKVYGTPLAAYTVGIAIQNPVFAKHNLTVPTTWDELKTTAKALKDAGETPIVLGGKDQVHTFFMYIGLASSVLGLDGVQKLRTGERKLTDPDVVAAAQLLWDLKPYFNAGFEATDYATAKAIFANEKGAMMVAGTADYTGYAQVNPKADLSFAAWPGPEAGKKATTTGFELLYTVSKFASADKQAAATKFVNWLASKDAQQLVSDKIAIPVNVNVTGSTDKIRQATVTAAAGGDVPVWYDIPELNGMMTAVQDFYGAFWAGTDSPDKFAANLQSRITPNPNALSGGAATPEATPAS